MSKTNSNISQANSIKKASVAKTALLGAGIGLLLILFFITGAETQPHWPELWKIRPLIITPLAGALGGSLAYIATKLLTREGLNRIVAIILSFIGFLIALWLGIVLGLDGTLWD
ncbi:hypothetical protein [Salinimicrobium xinjiangense]|uniref:hypothetical protein n=1 Tax=Salinimicrobium xinjiangense TaxID=438596 RepID=UPI00041BAF86|nr:hypothetical protein [Salinimicrobium xinjiangense]